MATMNAAGAKYNPDQYAFDKTLEGELFRLYFSDSWQQEYHSNLALKAKEAPNWKSISKRVEEGPINTGRNVNKSRSDRPLRP